MKSILFSSPKTGNFMKNSQENGESLKMGMGKKANPPAINNISFMVALFLTNMITALSFSYGPKEQARTISWEISHPHHSQILLALDLKTPYKYKKEVILTNKDGSLFIRNIILINSQHNENGFSELDVLEAQIYTVLIPTKDIERIRNQEKLIALPKKTPYIKQEKNKISRERINYEVNY